MRGVHLAAQQVFARSFSPPEVKSKAEQALKLVRLDHTMHKYPFGISGGIGDVLEVALPGPRESGYDPQITTYSAAFRSRRRSGSRRRTRRRIWRGTSTAA
jgi:hypothetical protein